MTVADMKGGKPNFAAPRMNGGNAQEADMTDNYPRRFEEALKSGRFVVR